MEVLRAIAGIEIFPVVSLLLFVVFFTGMLVWTARLDRRQLARLSHLPLDTASRDAADRGTDAAVAAPAARLQDQGAML